jgi:hypothetical protein
VLVPHILDGNVLAIEYLIPSPSTTQTLPFAGAEMPFCVRWLHAFQQRHYRQGNQLTLKLFSCSFKQCNQFPVSLKICHLCEFEMW